MTKNEINIHNSQVGVASGSGTVTADAITFNSGLSAEALAGVLDRFAGYVRELENPEFRRQGEEIVTELTSAPKKSAFERAINFLKLANSGLTAGSGIASHGGELIHDLSGVMEFSV